MYESSSAENAGIEMKEVTRPRRKLVNEEIHNSYQHSANITRWDFRFWRQRVRKWLSSGNYAQCVLVKVYRVSEILTAAVDKTSWYPKSSWQQFKDHCHMWWKTRQSSQWVSLDVPKRYFSVTLKRKKQINMIYNYWIVIWSTKASSRYGDVRHTLSK